jgi:hypothetical protein
MQVVWMKSYLVSGACTAVLAHHFNSCVWCSFLLNFVVSVDIAVVFSIGKKKLETKGVKSFVIPIIALQVFTLLTNLSFFSHFFSSFWHHKFWLLIYHRTAFSLSTLLFSLSWAVQFPFFVYSLPSLPALWISWSKSGVA